MQLFNIFYRRWQGGLLFTLLLVIPSLYANPMANFVVTPTTGCVPIRIFLDASSSQPSVGAQMTAYYWQSSGGQGILPREVSSVYLTNAGTYTFTLTVTDSTGMSANSQQSITVTPAGGSNCDDGDDIDNLVMAQFTAFPSSSDPLQVILDASASTGTITDYIWESNNGQYIEHDKMTTVAYSQAGTYTITLTVESWSGATDSLSKTITVGNGGSIDPGTSSQVTYDSTTRLLKIPEVVIDGNTRFAIEMKMTNPESLTFNITSAIPK
jgi:endoglucanase